MFTDGYDPKTGKPRPLNPDRVLRAWKRACREAGVQDWQRVWFHDTKHTFISDALYQGEKPYLVQRYVRHSTPLMLDRYTHADQQELDDMGKRLAENGHYVAPDAPESGKGQVANQ